MLNMVKIREDIYTKQTRVVCAVILYGIIGVMILMAVAGIFAIFEPLQKIFLGVPIAFVFLAVNTFCAIYGATKIIDWMRKKVS